MKHNFKLVIAYDGTEYNRADTVNLENIADIVYDRMVREYVGF